MNFTRILTLLVSEHIIIMQPDSPLKFFNVPIGQNFNGSGCTSGDI